MEVDDDFTFTNHEQVGFEELGMEDLEDLEDGTTLVGADDLVEYSAGEDEAPEELLMDIGIAKVEPSEETPSSIAPQTVITSPNITVKRVVNSKPVSSGTAVLQSVVPKQTNLIKVTNAAGKMMLMQKHTTTAVTSAQAPVKLLNSTRTSPGATAGSTTSYHLVKSEDGIVRPKLAAASQTMIRRVVPAGEAKPKMVVKAPTHVVIHAKSGSSSGTTTKTVTVAEAHQMGLLNNNKVKQMMMAKQTTGGQAVSRSPVKAVASASGTSMVRLKQSPGAPTGATQKIIVKANPPKPGTQKVVMSQSAIQAGQQSGQIQAINIPGKGIQYVRFLNNSGSSPAATAKIAQQKLLQMQVNKAAANAPPGSKIIVQNNKTYVLSNGNVTAVRAAPNSSQTQQFRTVTSGSQHIIRKTVIPSGRTPMATTIKKEPESTHYIALVKKEDGKQTETVTTLTQAQYGQLKTSTVTLAGGTKTKIVMVPSSATSTSASSSSQQQSSSLVTVKRESISGSEDETRKGPAVGTIFPDEAYKKRPCNCTKSQCLKLYCDCFANGEFCYNCNCRDCYNNLDNEEERQKAIRATLERNPSAFKPKIGATSAAEDATRRHTKGCNCKRSGCLKNYCECYEAKIACSGNCKCIGCRNTEQYAKEYDYAAGVTDTILGGNSPDQSLDHSGLLDSSSNNATMVDAGTAAAGGVVPSLEYGLIGAGEGSSSFALVGAASTATGAGPSSKRKLEAEPDLTQLPPSKQPYNFMTPDVIEATVQCMIAQADECQKRGCNIRTAERMILEEFGRCLVEIIDFSTKSDS